MTSIRLLKKRLALLALGALVVGAASTAPAVRAQDSGALLNVLVRKGILSDQEAENVRAELAAESHEAVTATISGGKSTKAISITGRLQAQYAGLSTDPDSGNSPPAANHFFLRRVYFGVKTTLNANWSADLNYDFAGKSFDKAYIRWAGNISDLPFQFDIGYRKVNFGYEEYTSSGSLKAIERSGATRYFAEDANGRRLGAASYRIGLFADYNPAAFSGKATGFFAGLAITDPERNADVTFVADTTSPATAGKSNTLAYWVNAGYSGKLGAVKYLAGVVGAWLPDQGGLGNTNIGLGDDITQGAAFLDVTFGRLQVATEFLHAEVGGTAPGGAKANSYVKGFWIQPSCMLTEKLELVARYSHTDTDGRGIRVSDGIRSSNTLGSAATTNYLNEYYLGLNYYLLGNDLKLQFGYVGGETAGGRASNGIANGAANQESVSGFRSQLQVNF
jgi:phosphate-selective porin